MDFETSGYDLLNDFAFSYGWMQHDAWGTGLDLENEDYEDRSLLFQRRGLRVADVEYARECKEINEPCKPNQTY